MEKILKFFDRNDFKPLRQLCEPPIMQIYFTYIFKVKL